MAAFSASWLDLREPADHAARAIEVTRFVADALHERTTLGVLDLGAGTGSNLRYLVSHLSGEQRWTLVDHDPLLLSETTRRVRASEFDATLLTTGVNVDAGRYHVSVREQDLRALDASLFDRVGLVTASALLDLVSDAWIESLVERCVAAGASALFALTYDGRIVCTPGDPDDEWVVSLVNRHQRTDKGFGAAAGPAATSVAAARFALAGYQTRRARSDWALGPGSAELQRQLVVGWAEAASAMDRSTASRVKDWRARRLAHIAAGRSSILVGHEDLGCVCPR